MPAKRLLAAIVVVSISASALLLALWPIFSVVVAAKVLHAIASSLLGPTLVAISLGLVGHAAFSIRLGRNVRFLSLGNAIAAGVSGGIAYYYANQAIFFLTAALGIPTLIALAQINSSEIDPELARGGIPKSGVGGWFNAVSAPPTPDVFLKFRRHHSGFSARQRGDAPNPGRDIGKARPGNGCLGAINMLILVPQFVVVAMSALPPKADRDSEFSDVVLWLYSQFQKNKPLPPKCVAIVDYVRAHGWENDFSFAGVERSFIQKYGAILSTPLTAEQEICAGRDAAR